MSKVNEGSEGDNADSSNPDISSSQPESEDMNSASDKFAADGKAEVLCLSHFSVLHVVQVLIWLIWSVR